MSKKDWITREDGWPIDPTADKACNECGGIGILGVYPPPSGMQLVLAECFCIPDRDDESKRATEYLGEPTKQD